MAEMEWIKISSDIFDNEKIKLIDAMPEHDAIIVIWFKLLCLAGKQNNSGVFLLNERIPYTDEMFASIFGRPVNTVRFALKTFEDFGMIEVIDGVVTLPNWGKHQNLQKLESRRDYMRGYMQEYRKKQRAMLPDAEGEKQAPENGDDSKPNSKTNSKHLHKGLRKQGVSALEESKRESKNKNKRERERKVSANATTEPARSPYGTFGNVLLSDEEKRVLEERSARWEYYIERLSAYMKRAGKDYNGEHLAVLLSWIAEDETKGEATAEKDKPKRDPKFGEERDSDYDDFVPFDVFAEYGERSPNA